MMSVSEIFYLVRQRKAFPDCPKAHGWWQQED
ncbi:hypothetical protein M798_10860 [Brucella melitensis ADMAS-G1]|nr:hypothetical protein M798_10860 [Brucella melitensis ADMAS-G1]